MADIISISAHASADRRPSRSAESEVEAEIIVFPGVRYERADGPNDEADEPGPDKGKTRRRSGA